MTIAIARCAPITIKTIKTVKTVSAISASFVFIVVYLSIRVIVVA